LRRQTVSDAERIPLVLRQIERLWRRYPDWRLGQLVCNLAAWADPTQNIVWDIEDDALVAEVERHLAQQEPTVESGR
jgi:hypothetical protein